MQEFFLMHKESGILKYNNMTVHKNSVYNVAKKSELYRYCSENVWDGQIKIYFNLEINGEQDED